MRSSSEVRHCGSTSRRFRLKNGRNAARWALRADPGSMSPKPGFQKSPRQWSRRSGSAAKMVCWSFPASILTRSPRRFRASTCCPPATRPEKKTRTPEVIADSPKSLRCIASTPTSSPSHSWASCKMAPFLPFPSRLRKAPTAPPGTRPAQGSKYLLSSAAVSTAPGRAAAAADFW